MWKQLARRELTMKPDRPFTFTDSLDGSAEPSVRLAELLCGAKAWIEATNLARLLDSMLVDRAGCRALFDDSDRIDHIGFLLPSWAKLLVSHAASEAGFPLGHRAFPSALVARELGRISGRRRLETQIFKAHGRTATAMAAFEAFIPAADDTQVEAWIRHGVGNHIAVEIGSPARFAQIRSMFEEAGVAMAGFMYGRAIYLPGEDATIMYFDLDGSEHPFRLEVRAQGELVHD